MYFKYIVFYRSPDGLKVLTNSEDKRLRIFNIEESDDMDQCINLYKVSQIKEGGTIYDYVWYPNIVNKSESTHLLVNVHKLNYILWRTKYINTIIN